MIMGRCRACRRIAARRKKLGYWRPFVFFSIAVHLTATIAFSQFSMTYRGSVQDKDLSFVKLVKLPHDYAHAGDARNLTSPLKAAAQKSEKNNKGALEERTVPSTVHEEKLVETAA